MSTAVATAVEIVQFPTESKRALGWFDSLARDARAEGIDVIRSTRYQDAARWLLLWGPGAPDRASVMKRHVATGGHVIALDLAYWNRDRKARVSFDAAHPAAWVMRGDLRRDRFEADPAPISNQWRPSGKIVIAGLGDKARVQYGADVIDRWENAMAAACRARWPDRPLVYRKKKVTSPVPAWGQVAPMQPIETVLAGASLVITWHSNVAVDAIRMGIPVVCKDGAAAAVCPASLPDHDPQPLAASVRDQFLWNLSWFQWAPEESRSFWRFVQGVLA